MSSEPKKPGRLDQIQMMRRMVSNRLVKKGMDRRKANAIAANKFPR